MKKSIKLFTTVMVCMAMALCVSCKKDDDNNNPGGGGGGTQTVATVTTEEVTEITQTTAVCGGEVKSENGWAVTERGVCWGTEPNPTPSDNCTVDGDGIGKFTSVITGLIPGTKYYVRAYAKNAAGTGFGAERSFTTLENGGGGGGTQTVATVTTEEVTEITQTTAVCGGEVKSENGWAVTERGVCWGTEPNPTPSDNCTVDGDGIGKFTSVITGLIPGTKYYVRAYAKNAAGTGFGAERSFTTLENGGGGGGRFSVNSTTTVEFAPGNLYYDGSAFRFEANQWSFADTWNARHVSHFKWSDAANAVTGDYNYSGDLFCASNFTVAGDSRTWHTLTRDEWNYLLNSRAGASSLRAWVTLTDVRVSGLVILPDGSSATASGITTSSALAASGAVFLPAAGYRDCTDVLHVGSYGDYWSSTPHEDYEDFAYYMCSYSGGVFTKHDGRYSGHAVRLVR